MTFEQQRQVMIDAGLPQRVGEDNARALSLFAEGDADYVSDDVAAILGRPSQTFEQFVPDHTPLIRQSTHLTAHRKGFTMTTQGSTDRTEHLLSLMKRGDDAFNAHDFLAMDEVHHPDMVAYITGNAEPLYGRAAHAAAMRQFFEIFPDVHVYNDPYPFQFGSGDWITVVSRVVGTFTGRMVAPDGTVIPPTGKSFDQEFTQTSKWDGDQLVEISAFWDSAEQARQIGLA